MPTLTDENQVESVFVRWPRLVKLSNTLKEDCEKGGFDTSKPDDSAQRPVTPIVLRCAPDGRSS